MTAKLVSRGLAVVAWQLLSRVVLQYALCYSRRKFLYYVPGEWPIKQRIVFVAVALSGDMTEVELSCSV